MLISSCKLLSVSDHSKIWLYEVYLNAEFSMLLSFELLKLIDNMPYMQSAVPSAGRQFPAISANIKETSVR